MSLGFWYRWDPRPPQKWINAYKDWAVFCRETITGNRRGLDTELQVKIAVDAWHYPIGADILATWREMEPTFKPNTVVVWVDDTAVKACVEWARKSPGVIWVEHVDFGCAVAKLAGIPYYREGGRDDNGRFIEDHPGDSSYVASVRACGTGFNLQAHSRALVAIGGRLGAGDTWEQLLGRHHRTGQKADAVSFEWICSSIEHVESFDAACDGAKYIETTIAGPQRLRYADLTLPKIGGRTGPLWQK
jgi:hypothetical protein